MYISTNHMLTLSGIPHLKNTRLILIALPIIFLLYIVVTIIGWNATISFVNFYKYRVY